MSVQHTASFRAAGNSDVNGRKILQQYAFHPRQEELPCPGGLQVDYLRVNGQLTGTFTDNATPRTEIHCEE